MMNAEQGKPRKRKNRRSILSRLRRNTRRRQLPESPEPERDVEIVAGNRVFMLGTRLLTLDNGETLRLCTFYLKVECPYVATPRNRQYNTYRRQRISWEKLDVVKRQLFFD